MFRLCVGDGIVLKIVIRIVLVVMSSVLFSDYFVNGLFNINVVYIELKISFVVCNVDNIGRGSVEICIVLLSRLVIMNMFMLSCY